MNDKFITLSSAEYQEFGEPMHILKECIIYVRDFDSFTTVGVLGMTSPIDVVEKADFILGELE